MHGGLEPSAALFSSVLSRPRVKAITKLYGLVDLTIPIRVLHGISVRGNECCPESYAGAIMITGGALWKRNGPHRSTPPLTKSTRSLRSSGNISRTLRLDAISPGTCRRLLYCARIEMHCSGGRGVGGPYCSAGKRKSRSTKRNGLNPNQLSLTTLRGSLSSRRPMNLVCRR